MRIDARLKQTHQWVVVDRFVIEDELVHTDAQLAPRTSIDTGWQRAAIHGWHLKVDTAISVELMTEDKTKLKKKKKTSIRTTNTFYFDE
ncbi:hypothetical protein STCU_12272 [Strigomonas culicis]|uniref:Uncharacterized protein n=1 Tax=Strigomonas culicis TaxID=28005 RepID=S9TB26_9TRYP|nr:hypothetical protein STCU_12272 [Strigomonas culicis]|eukprot:EPY15187.1 hypothetical protein STCU_12272 [Strigomonas culicis]